MHSIVSVSQTQDGAERKVVVNSKIVYPYGVAVDYPNRHIFWVDTYLDYIERADYDGRDRRTILRGSPIQNLYSVTVFQGRSLVRVWFAFGSLGVFSSTFISHRPFHFDQMRSSHWPI